MCGGGCRAEHFAGWSVSRHMRMARWIAAAVVGMVGVGVVALGAGPAATGAGSGAGKKITLAVLPFVYKTDAEKALAEKMRYAVREKMSADGRWDRKDQVEVDQTISALGVVFSDGLPEDEDLKKVVAALGVDQAVTGVVEGRKLTLTLYDAGAGGCRGRRFRRRFRRGRRVRG